MAAASVAVPAKKANNSGIVILVLVVAALIGGAMLCNGEDGPPGALDAYAMSQVFVQRSLKAPATAKFARMSEADIVDLGGGQWRVTAWVDSENGFGALVRNTFVAHVRWTGGDDWRLVDLEFSE